MAAPARLLTLDAMRGLAAIMVLLHHVETSFAPSGYLAVDFFFLLSGFVIARTYEASLFGESAGLAFLQFVKLRIIRLYPLFALGLAIGLVRCIGQMVLERPDRMSVSELGISVLFQLFMLPSPATKPLFPLNMPAWSLFFEMAINLAYASILVRMRLRTLVAASLVSGVLLAWVAVSNGSLDAGFRWDNFHGGMARVVFAFTVGVTLARLRRDGARESSLALIPMLALVGVLMVSVEGSGRVAYDLFVAFVVAPGLVWLGATYDPRPMLRRVSQSLGELSYPVYAIHYPLLLLIGSAVRRTGVPYAVWVPIFIGLTSCVAWALDRYWDKPIRRSLNAWARSGQLAAPRHVRPAA